MQASSAGVGPNSPSRLRVNVPSPKVSMWQHDSAAHSTVSARESGCERSFSSQLPAPLSPGMHSPMLGRDSLYVAHSRSLLAQTALIHSSMYPGQAAENALSIDSRQGGDSFSRPLASSSLLLALPNSSALNGYARSFTNHMHSAALHTGTSPGGDAAEPARQGSMSGGGPSQRALFVGVEAGAEEERALEGDGCVDSVADAAVPVSGDGGGSGRREEAGQGYQSRGEVEAAEGAEGGPQGGAQRGEEGEVLTGEGEEYEGFQIMCYHEVTAKPAVDPVTKK